MSVPRFRRPSADEHQVLRELVVRPIRPDERDRFDALLVEHHHLKSAALVGRVRTPNAAHAPGLFRRVVVSVIHVWLERVQKKKPGPACGRL